jgi:hypothetical protein
MHPTFNQLTRSMATLAHSARTVQSIVNMVNTSFIRQNTSSVETEESLHRLNSAYRDLEMAKKAGDLMKMADAQERINIELARQKEMKMEKEWSAWDNALQTIIISILGVNQTFDFIKKTGPSIVSIFSKIAGFLATSTFGAALASPIVQIPALALLAGLAISEFFARTNEGFRLWRENNGRILEDFFLVQIPSALGIAAQFLTQFFLTDLPNWATLGWETVKTVFITVWNAISKGLEGGINGFLGGFEGFVNAIINGINRIIRGLNKLPGVKIGQISPISLPRVSIPTIAAANGFEGMVNSPTMFLAGEAGPESVSITPRGKSGGGIIINIHNHIGGSVLAEKQLVEIMDRNLKSELRRRNYRLL